MMWKPHKCSILRPRVQLNNSIQQTSTVAPPVPCECKPTSLAAVAAAVQRRGFTTCNYVISRAYLRYLGCLLTWVALEKVSAFEGGPGRDLLMIFGLSASDLAFDCINFTFADNGSGNDIFITHKARSPGIDWRWRLVVWLVGWLSSRFDSLPPATMTSTVQVCRAMQLKSVPTNYPLNDHWSWRAELGTVG